MGPLEWRATCGGIFVLQSIYVPHESTRRCSRACLLPRCFRVSLDVRAACATCNVCLVLSVGKLELIHIDISNGIYLEGTKQTAELLVLCRRLEDSTLASCANAYVRTRDRRYRRYPQGTDDAWYQYKKYTNSIRAPKKSRERAQEEATSKNQRTLRTVCHHILFAAYLDRCLVHLNCQALKRGCQRHQHDPADAHRENVGCARRAPVVLGYVLRAVAIEYVLIRSFHVSQ